jgi:Ca2+-transporting ATPase
LCQIFNEFNARKPEEKNVFKGVTNNHLFMGIVGATTGLQVTCYVNAFTWFDRAPVLTLYQILIIEFLGKFFDTARLNWRLWMLSVAIGAVRYASMLLNLI